ncbi:amino acid/amide ABC transporter ATP-binding protein 2, HAAT family [Thermaerobacter marianensis DSM 12885]|uniref:Amino acid/amide ABC transporter ATP-binding protein 2, HAAT family n=1 Tax=Thermaerobacter marianensis (strain ATCC 700841 / DSM 12885 / JCM 10246 / 7p75a) TaxID=644966 RepID=E6SHS2_THEM7|nr:ABC transporter ATP-binding protein [Thermaerobacter marianensis]ADU50769.1 amino acid/amide ABC transporter ATP-binding protein 2, HAAT family [Thermaerobacter marianensis DSM 12885]
MLRVDDLHVFYGPIHALKGVSLAVEEGEIVTLIGANGAGKTTLLRAISGLTPPRRGTIHFQGRSLLRRLPEDIVRLGVSHVPEGRRIFANLTVQENLELGAFLRNDRAELARDLQRVFDLFPRLRERLHQLAGTLSGGEQQMLAIGRALMARPRLLLLDEPSLGLAPLLVRTIFDVIREINGQGTTILLVEQNAHMALSVAHRAYVLETGRIVLEGPAEALRQSEAIRAAYLGGQAG